MTDEPSIPRLLFVAASNALVPSPLDTIAAAIDGGVDSIQLGGPGLSSKEWRSLAVETMRLAHGRANVVIAADIAVAVELGLGVVLAESGVATAEARRRLGAAPPLGRAVHSAAAAAAAGGASFLVATPVFAVERWTPRPVLGLATLTRIVEASWEPVIAGGGVTVEWVPSAIAAGAAGVAVGDAIANTDDPQAAATALRAAVDRALGPMAPAEPAARGADLTQVIVGGRQFVVEPDTTIADLLHERGLDERVVTVTLNGVRLARRTYESTVLGVGDEIAIE